MKRNLIFCVGCALLVSSAWTLAGPVYQPHRRKAFQSSAYTPYAATFAVAQLNHSGTLTGATDSGALTFSVWYDPSVADGTQQSLLRIDSNTTARFAVSRTTGNLIQVTGRNSSGTDVLLIVSSINVVAAGGYYHIAFRCDISGTPEYTLWINGVEDTSCTETTLDTGVIDLAAASPIQYVGNGTADLSGTLSELWFDDTDLGASAVSLFASGGDPIDLGADGSTPKGGTPPVLYLSRNGNGTSWIVDSSGNGNTFTINNGSLSDGTPP